MPLSADKIFAILDLYSEKKTPLSVAEISSLLNAPQSSVYRHVRLLKEKGFLMETEKGAYQLGYRFIELANIVRMDQRLSTIALPYMKKLTHDLGETTILSVISELSVVCVETVPSLQSIKVSSEQGKIVPIYAGASSKVILAYQSEELIDQLFSKQLVKKFTEKTLATKTELVENLAEIREKGYAISDSEIDVGVFSYGFPIRDSKRNVFASLTVAGPTHRMLQKNEQEIVLKCKQAVSEIEKYV